MDLLVKTYSAACVRCAGKVAFLDRHLSDIQAILWFKYPVGRRRQNCVKSTALRVRDCEEL